MPEGLFLAPGPGIPDGLTIPAAALTERFSRSPGPGGQSVNTSDTRVEVVLDLSEVDLPAHLRTRAEGALGTTVSVVASEHRSQHRNRVAARDRLADRLRAALAPPPPPRVPTKPSKGSQRRRMDAKTRRGQVKKLRGRVHD